MVSARNAESSPARERRARRAPALALLLALFLIALAIAVPAVFEWDVASRAARSADDRAVPPLHGVWVPHVGIASAAVVVIAALAWRFGPGLAQRLSWGALLAACCGSAFAWMFALALVDGPTGISRVLGNPYEYLETARSVESIGLLLSEYVSRIPADAAGNWVTHVAGHPPAMLLFFVALDRLGLGADFTSGLIVTMIAALIPLFVLTTLRRLGAEHFARRAAPFLVFSPAAVFLSVSADAVIATVATAGIALLACAATASRWVPRALWATASGLVLGTTVMMSYGMPLYGLLAITVLVIARSWWPLPIAAASALCVVLAFAAMGFTWWDALPVITERYWDGIASRRPGEYWLWANIAALLISAGPLVASGLAAAAFRSPARPEGDASGRRAVVWLTAAGVGMVVLADLSGMSRAEVERIWLPFIPWLTISLGLLDERWRRGALAGQLIWAILVQHLFYTVW